LTARFVPTVQVSPPSVVWRKLEPTGVPITADPLSASLNATPQIGWYAPIDCVFVTGAS
jgi:hypothetical protein